MKKILMIASLLLCASAASAGQIENIYADMDAKNMSGNINVLNYYSPDAVIISTQGHSQNVNELRDLMMNVIRAGGKVDVSQSRIIGTREIRTGVMNNLMGVVVFSQDYGKFSHPDNKDASKRVSTEMTALTTRVFDVSNKQKWLIVSEHSSEIK